jgi:hypothetical protein
MDRFPRRLAGFRAAIDGHRPGMPRSTSGDANAREGYTSSPLAAARARGGRNAISIAPLYLYLNVPARRRRPASHLAEALLPEKPVVVDPLNLLGSFVPRKPVPVSGAPSTRVSRHQHTPRGGYGLFRCCSISLDRLLPCVHTCLRAFRSGPGGEGIRWSTVIVKSQAPARAKPAVGQPKTIERSDTR